MGLDTVELVYAFENYFQIHIPDHIAETIGTVEQAAFCIAQLKGLPPQPERTAAYFMLLEQVLACLKPQYPKVATETLLTQLWPLAESKLVLPRLGICLQLEMPELSTPAPEKPAAAPTWLQRLFGPTAPAPQPPDWSRTTVADLTEWLLAQNYQRLLPTPATLYEVQRAVLGLTAEKCGVPVPEIHLTDSFTNDLGMD